MNTFKKVIAHDKNSHATGFTLLELLIVIAILAVLATVAVLVINPIEYLRQARDSQRIGDLAAVKGALDLYVSSATTIALGSCPATGRCTAAPAANPFTGTCVVNAGTGITGTGWVDVDLTTLAGGAPLPKLPIDPTNNSGYFYGYACNATNNTYELDTKLESAKYGGMASTDGGNNAAFYEVGSTLAL